MQKKKIKFDGLCNRVTGKPGQEAALILKLLQKHYDVELSDEPDYIFYNVHGSEYYKYDCVRIFCTIEAICPDFNFADYGIGFEYLEYGDRYFRFPNFGFYPGLMTKMAEKHENITDNMSEREFCSFVYSNAKAAPMRGELFQCLNAYKKVDSGGKYLNNLPDGHTVEDKFAFEAKHKFSIACENASHPGYHTEKIAEAFAARTVPIYWGDPRAAQVFNKRAYIDVNDYESLDDVKKRVQELDENDEMYLAMLRESALNVRTENGKLYEQNLVEEFERYILHIMEQPLEKAYRRNRGFWGEQYLDKKRAESNVVEKYMKIRNGAVGRLLRKMMNR